MFRFRCVFRKYVLPGVLANKKTNVNINCWFCMLLYVVVCGYKIYDYYQDQTRVFFFPEMCVSPTGWPNSFAKMDFGFHGIPHRSSGCISASEHHVCGIQSDGTQPRIRELLTNQSKGLLCLHCVYIVSGAPSCCQVFPALSPLRV